MSLLLKSDNNVFNIAFFSFFFPNTTSLLKSTPANKFNNLTPFKVVIVSNALFIISPILSSFLLLYR